MRFSIIPVGPRNITIHMVISTIFLLWSNSYHIRAINITRGEDGELIYLSYNTFMRNDEEFVEDSSMDESVENSPMDESLILKNTDNHLAYFYMHSGESVVDIIKVLKDIKQKYSFMDLEKYKKFKVDLEQKIVDTLNTFDSNFFVDDLEFKEETPVESHNFEDKFTNQHEFNVSDTKSYKSRYSEEQCISNEDIVDSEVKNTDDDLCCKQLQDLLSKFDSESDITTIISYLESIFSHIEDVTTTNISRLLLNTKKCNIYKTVIDNLYKNESKYNAMNVNIDRLKNMNNYVLQVLIKQLFIIVYIVTERMVNYNAYDFGIVKPAVNKKDDTYMHNIKQETTLFDLWVRELDVSSYIPTDETTGYKSVADLYQLQHIMLLYSNIAKNIDFNIFNALFYTRDNETPLCIILMFLYGMKKSCSDFLECIMKTKITFSTILQSQNKLEVYENSKNDLKLEEILDIIKLQTYGYNLYSSEKESLTDTYLRLQSCFLFNDRNFMYEEIEARLDILKGADNMQKPYKRDSIKPISFDVKYYIKHDALISKDQDEYINKRVSKTFISDINSFEFLSELTTQAEIINLYENPESFIFPENIEMLLIKIQEKNGYYDSKHLLSTCKPDIRCLFIMLFNNYKTKTNIAYSTARINICIDLFQNKFTTNSETILFLNALEESFGSTPDFVPEESDLDMFTKVISVYRDVCLKKMEQISIDIKSNMKEVNYRLKNISLELYLFVICKNIYNKISNGSEEKIKQMKKIYTNDLEDNNIDSSLFRCLISVHDIVSMEYQSIDSIAMLYEDAKKIYRRNNLLEIVSSIGANHQALYNFENSMYLLRENKSKWIFNSLCKLESKMKTPSDRCTIENIRVWNEYMELSCKNQFSKTVRRMHDLQNLTYNWLIEKIFKNSPGDSFLPTINEKNSEKDKMDIIIESHNMIMIMSMYVYYFINNVNLSSNQENMCKFTNLLVSIIRYNVKENITKNSKTLECIINLMLIIFNNINEERIKEINLFVVNFKNLITDVLESNDIINPYTFRNLERRFKLNQYETEFDKFNDLVMNMNCKASNKSSVVKYNSILENIDNLTGLVNMTIKSTDIFRINNNLISRFSYHSVLAPCIISLNRILIREKYKKFEIPATLSFSNSSPNISIIHEQLQLMELYCDNYQENLMNKSEKFSSSNSA